MDADTAVAYGCPNALMRGDLVDNENPNRIAQKDTYETRNVDPCFLCTRLCKQFHRPNDHYTGHNFLRHMDSKWVALPAGHGRAGLVGKRRRDLDY